MGNTHSGKPRKSLEKPGIPEKPGRFSSLHLKINAINTASKMKHQLHVPPRF
jgi:hypothetical protein